jgi:hypothetical protein
MDEEREVAMQLWPEHAEILNERDWAFLSSAVEDDVPVEDRITEPAGEAKDAFLASLIIIYWTMKLVHIALEIKHDVAHLKGEEKTTAIFETINARLDPSTPSQVVNSVREIIGNLGL